MGSELVRALIVMVCCANVTATLVIYGRMGRYFLPKLWMRLLILGNTVFAIGTLNLVYRRLHEPVSAGHFVLAAGAVVELVALGGLWHWYGTEAGQAHAQRMIDTG